jgi:hypothetical protein
MFWQQKRIPHRSSPIYNKVKKKGRGCLRITVSRLDWKETLAIFQTLP